MNFKAFLRSRPRTASCQNLLLFLEEKNRATAHKNAVHLFQSLHPLCLAHPDLSAVMYVDLVAWAERLTLQYSVGSIRSKLIDIRTFFRWAVDRRVVPVNVAQRLKLPRSRPRDKSAKESDYLRVIRGLAEQLNGRIERNVFGWWEIVPGLKWQMRSHVHVLRDLLMLVLLYETGCRAGEAAKLSTRAMDRAVASPAGSEDHPVYTLAVIGKSGVRYRSFTRATAELWGLWEQVRPKVGRDYVFVKWNKLGVIPVGLTSDDVTQIVARRTKKLAGYAFRPHSIRHAKAKRARRLGGIQVAADLLDHHDLSSTLFYTVEDEAELNAAILSTGLSIDLW